MAITINIVDAFQQFCTLMVRYSHQMLRWSRHAPGPGIAKQLPKPRWHCPKPWELTIKKAWTFKKPPKMVI